MVPRKTDDAKYAPVYSAILARSGMSPQYREEAAEALSELGSASITSVLLDAFSSVEGDDRSVRRTQRELASRLLSQPAAKLAENADVLMEATKSDDSFVRSVGFAALVSAGQESNAMDRAKADDEATLSWLKSIELIPSQPTRSTLRDAVVYTLADSSSAETKNAAISALGFIDSDSADTYQLVAPLVANPSLRRSAVKTLLKANAKSLGSDVSASLLGELVSYAETTPAADRTSPEFTDAMQLADGLMGKVPDEVANQSRKRLSAITVRMIRIKTVEEEMRYDIAYFAARAGRPIQIVLENDDLMPHNLVFTMPDKLKDVVQLGLDAGPNNGANGLPYVPQSDLVLEATEMVAAHAESRLTFTAPSEPGEYPYVCTFPQHWYRMYGVMVVVEDLDAWLKNPTVPANPIGSNRTFVQSWTVDDFKGEMENGLVGRTAEIGKRIFVEASCAGCHKMSGEGGVIGPELTDVMTRWKGDGLGVLREILDPSHKIDTKYLMQRILTVDGRTVTGVLVSEDDINVTLLSSSEAKPTVVAQDDIEAMVPSSVSMMPKALMDQYTKDEIFELMKYLESAGSNSGI